MYYIVSRLTMSNTCCLRQDVTWHYFRHNSMSCDSRQVVVRLFLCLIYIGRSSYSQKYKVAIGLNRLDTHDVAFQYSKHALNVKKTSRFLKRWYNCPLWVRNVTIWCSLYSKDQKWYGVRGTIYFRYRDDKSDHSCHNWFGDAQFQHAIDFNFLLYVFHPDSQWAVDIRCTADILTLLQRFTNIACPC